MSPTTYPVMTLLMQSLGSIGLVLEAVVRFTPDIFIDTMGYSFAVAVVKILLNIPTAAYVHYPTISSDMLSQPGLGSLKRIYWNWFARLYSYAGLRIDYVMANSSWTGNHLRELWGVEKNGGNLRGRQRYVVLFPPCNVSDVFGASLSHRRNEIVYLAQFRKEKNHPLLVEAMRMLVYELHVMDARMIFVGSVRGQQDIEAVAALRLSIQSCRLEKFIEIRCDLPWSDVVAVLTSASIGANAMWNEHFGIGVVEYMVCIACFVSVLIILQGCWTDSCCT